MLLPRSAAGFAVRSQPPATSSSGLSGGAIAGITVGCTVAVCATAAAAGWLLVRRRHAARPAVLDAAAAAEAAEKAPGASTPAGHMPCPGETARSREGDLHGGTLGCPPTLLGAAAPIEAALHLYDAGSGSGSASANASGSMGSSPVLMAAVIARPRFTTSPFAAARARKSPGGSATSSPSNSSCAGGGGAPGGALHHPKRGMQPGSSAAMLSSEEGSGPREEPALQQELSRVMGDMIAQRECREAAASTLSAGQLSAEPSGSSGQSPPAQPLEVVLPSALQASCCVEVGGGRRVPWRRLSLGQLGRPIVPGLCANRTPHLGPLLGGAGLAHSSRGSGVLEAAERRPICARRGRQVSPGGVG